MKKLAVIAVLITPAIAGFQHHRARTGDAARRLGAAQRYDDADFEVSPTGARNIGSVAR